MSKSRACKKQWMSLEESLEAGQEEGEDDWEEGEINEEDETHERHKVPETDNHDKHLDGEDRNRIDEEDHIVNSRLNLDPNRIDAQSESNCENIARSPVQNNTPMGDTHECEVHSSTECDINNLTNPDALKDQNKNKEGGGEGESELCPNQIQLEIPIHSPSPLREIEMDSDRNRGNQGQPHKVVLSSCPGEDEIEVQHIQEDALINKDTLGHEVSVGGQPSGDLDGVESSQSIDLNSEPLERYDWFDIAEEELVRYEKTKKSKNKDKKSKKLGKAISSSFPVTMKPKDVLKSKFYRKNKKADQSHKNRSNPNKSENSINISEEILKSKNVGLEVGFQMEGFDEMLRNEIEGEGMIKKQS
ncbi:hypothetical protein L2E82_37645 [Cichorium intybus]|uniref:Uncharacterized protein n=1 Tax=Cichorium intybus TaxID=13427 RepID=A0ACB9AJ63_CICIN|nr:hypothetical protein L2E82_37645 [Cichorium intybus]